MLICSNLEVKAYIYTGIHFDAIFGIWLFHE